MSKITVEQIKEWIEVLNEVNTEKGWRQEGLEICDFAANIHAEISEAFEDYRNNHDINEVWYEHKIYGDVVKLEYKYITKKIYFDEFKKILGKPCGVPSELSDIVIRALDMVGYYGWEEEFIMAHNEFRINYYKLKIGDTFTYIISQLHETVSDIFKLQEYKARDKDYAFHLYYLIEQCSIISEKYKIDLVQQINDKIAYNKTRPARHGGKRV